MALASWGILLGIRVQADAKVQAAILAALRGFGVAQDATLVVADSATSLLSARNASGLTFATVDDKMDVTPVRALDYKPAAETAAEHRLNLIFSLALIATVVGLWFHFR